LDRLLRPFRYFGFCLTREDTRELATDSHSLAYVARRIE
jgi:hypothetical protein